MTDDLPRSARRSLPARLLRGLQRFPGTVGLVALSLGFFGLATWMGPYADTTVVTRLGALRPDRIAPHTEYYRLVMPMFLHHHPLHLLLNMLALVQLGLLVEYIWGTRRLLVAYGLCGLAASLVTWNFTPYGLPSVGASGALMGLAGWLLGARYLGTPALRLFLGEVLGRRLFWGVLFTFVVGVLLEVFFPFVDNWGHLGGFLAGLMLAGALPDVDSGKAPVNAAGAALVPLVVGSGVWMAWSGDDALATYDADTAWALRVKSSDYRGSLAGAMMLVTMLEHYEAAGDGATGREVFRRELAHVDEPLVLQLGVLAPMLAAEGWGDELVWALERWVELEPLEPQALNALAWHLLVHPDPSRREPERAEELVRKALRRIEEPTSEAGKSARAAYLDTLGEALLQLGEVEEALTVQSESLQLATELELSDRPEIEARLQRIQEADG